jgi:hypothetical protein
MGPHFVTYKEKCGSTILCIYKASLGSTSTSNLIHKMWSHHENFKWEESVILVIEPGNLKYHPIKSRSTDADKVNTPANTHYCHLYRCHWQNGYLLWCIIPLIVSNLQLKTNHHNILVWHLHLCAHLSIAPVVTKPSLHAFRLIFKFGSAMFGNGPNRGENPTRTKIVDPKTGEWQELSEGN